MIPKHTKELEKIKEEFEKKFCNEDNGRSVKDWKGFWEEIDVYAEDVWSFIAKALQAQHTEDTKFMGKLKREWYQKGFKGGYDRGRLEIVKEIKKKLPKERKTRTQGDSFYNHAIYEVKQILGEVLE